MNRLTLALVLLGGVLGLCIHTFVQPAAHAASGSSQKIKLAGDFQDSNGARGKFRYEEKSSGPRIDHRFEAKLNHLPPNTVLDLYVNDWWVGAVTSNSQGKVNLRMQFSVRGDWEPVPSAFPTLQAGDVITIGTASAVLTQK
jgi:hypothetical protein